MPGFENKLGEYSYNEPGTTKCKLKGPFGTWTWVPCHKNIKRKTAVYFGLNYPPVRPEQQAAIYQCAYKGGAAAWAIIAGSIVTCVGGPACVAAIAAAIPAANEAGRKTFYECLNALSLPQDVKRNTNFLIYKKSLE